MLWLWLMIGLASAGPAAPGLPLGRELRVSVGRDHVFIQLRAVGEPATLGLLSWAPFDRDGDGALSRAERRPLLDALRRHETEYAALSVGETPIRWERLETVALPDQERTPLDAPLVYRVQGRTPLAPSPGGWPFMFYDRPTRWQGAVPIRLSVAHGLGLSSLQGARFERRSPERVDAVLSNRAPAFWGRVGPAR